MVEFRAPNGHMDDHQRDVTTISTAFRFANDQDTRDIMNAMSNPTPENLKCLKFYAVPASWMVKAWPLLSFRPGISSFYDVPTQQQVGKICNSRLITETGSAYGEDDRKPIAVVSNDDRKVNLDFEKKKANFEILHRRMTLAHQNRSGTRMRLGLQHGKDYFFLGRAVWEVIKLKFGFDGHEICRTCCKAMVTSSEKEEEQGTIAVALMPGEGSLDASSPTTSPMGTVVIPPTGRFPYEKMVPTLEISNESDPANDLSSGDNRNTSLVTWADGGEPAKGPIEENRIILRPSSSTPINQLASSPQFTDKMNDMDLDSKSDRDSTCDESVLICKRKRLASGLSNLGNTCFMNSTLQCLSNTEDLRRYFLSGDYVKDLNTDNPLGTGGQLATQFARLLGEMWEVPSKRRNILGHSTYSNSYSYSSYHSAVAPRDFKICVGRHAEQFMGYDQHDSQEFATYLLDALHEDTNRVTKKPYIEKPEQGEDEPDDVAAEKAWKLHLQREDSHVLENFMGQVKSRLECCEPGCNRVSTTFDPIMYLSVPIPGSTERTLKVTFVPLDPLKKGVVLSLKVSKLGKISDVVDIMNAKLCQSGYQNKDIPCEDLVVADVWNHDVYKWREMTDDVGSISDTDHTIVYQLQPLENIRKIAKRSGSLGTIEKSISKASRKSRGCLDLATMAELNRNDSWMESLTNVYSRDPRSSVRSLNPKITPIEGLVDFYKELEIFLDECQAVLEKEESGGLKRARETLEENEDSEGMELEVEGSSSEDSEPTIQGLVDCSTVSRRFCDVKNRRDFAVLEFCEKKLRQRIIQATKEEGKCSEDMLVQVSFIKKDGWQTKARVAPLIIRIPRSTTVFEFRKLVADRVSRSLDISHSTDDISVDFAQQEMRSGEMSEEMNEMNTGEPSSETEGVEKLHNTRENDRPHFEPSAFLIMRRAELKYERGHSSSKFSSNLRVLGMVQVDTQIKVAVASNEKEQTMMDVVGDRGVVTIMWEEEYDKNVFDEIEFERAERLDENSSIKKDAITVMDCIKQYCQKEQLEESEMWYCNRCKNHVRAWKQFHLHRTPPYLIVHLKRFYFSALSRRRDKISDFIDFPLEGLDLTDLVADYDETTKPVYDCYAVSNHIGGLGGGHYTAYVLCDDSGSWSYYNDSSVTEKVDEKEVVSAEAYVLYYRRRDVPIGQDKEYRLVPDQSRRSTPMICETVSPIDQRSEASSTNTAQAGDMDATLDDIGSNASSGAATSPMGSLDNGNLQEDGLDDGDLYSERDDFQTDENYPLQ